MSDFKYKAFISYSHTDEKWAKWLDGSDGIYVVRSISGLAGDSGWNCGMS